MEKFLIEEIEVSKMNMDKHPHEVNEAELKEAVEQLKTGDYNPVILNRRYGREDTVIYGHAIVKAAKQENIEKVKVIYVDISKEEEDNIYRPLYDKVIQWNYEDVLGKWYVPKQTGKEVYTEVMSQLFYEPSSGPEPSFEDCLDMSEYNRAMEDISKYDLTDEEKRIARICATRFIKFRYGRFADKYARASGDAKKMYERLLMVVIDVDRSIEFGMGKMITMVFEKDHKYEDK